MAAAQDTTPSQQDAPRPSALTPFRSPIFRAVWLATLASNFGALIQSVGASWMMTSLTDSPAMVALVQASVTLPIMLLSLAAGAIADNGDRRVVMLGAQTFMLFVSTALAICAWGDALTPWLLLTFTFLVGCGTAVNGPAWQASVGDMVPRSELPGAVSLNAMGFNIARSTGPAIGGIVVAAAGAAAAFTINAVSYFGLIAVLLRWRPQRPPRLLPPETLGVAMAAGIRYGAMSPHIRTVLIRAAIFGTGAAAIQALMPLIARNLIGGGAITYGLLLGSFGLGAVTGAFSTARVRARATTEQIAVGGSIAVALSALIVGISTVLPLTMFALIFGGAGWVLVLSTFNVTVQLSAPRWVVARALSLYQMGAFGGMALGSWLWGLIAAATTIEHAMVGAAAFLLAGAVLGRWIPLAKLDMLDLDPLRTWDPPATAVPIENRSGPITVAIEYRIRPEDVPAFLTVMAERRQIRRRDGARHWQLSRDLGDAEIWIEQFSLPTWLDYIRHNNRVTRADAGVTDRIRALHQGPGLPRVRRTIERQTGSLPLGRLPGARELASPLDP